MVVYVGPGIAFAISGLIFSFFSSYPLTLDLTSLIPVARHTTCRLLGCQCWKRATPHTWRYNTKWRELCRVAMG